MNIKDVASGLQGRYVRFDGYGIHGGSGYRLFSYFIEKSKWEEVKQIPKYYERPLLLLDNADIVVVGDMILKNRYGVSIADFVTLATTTIDYQPLIEVI